MNEQTAQLVAFIGQQVRTRWLGLPKTARLETINYALHNSELQYSNLHRSRDRISLDIHTGMHTKELIYLTIDGQLGVYFPGEDDKSDCIHIELLTPRKVRLTKVYEVDVPCVGDESESTLFAYALESNLEFITTHYEEIK